MKKVINLVRMKASIITFVILFQTIAYSQSTQDFVFASLDSVQQESITSRLKNEVSEYSVECVLSDDSLVSFSFVQTVQIKQRHGNGVAYKYRPTKYKTIKYDVKFDLRTDSVIKVKRSTDKYWHNKDSDMTWPM
jgi:hypothetical protein